MKLSIEQSALRIKELESRLEEYEQLVEAIKAGEVDAFALNKNNHSEIFTLQGSDYAYRMLVENFGEGALNLSDETVVVYTNSYFLNLLQLPYEDVIGKPFLQFIHPESKETFNKLFKKGLAGKSKGEINLIAGKHTIPVYVSLTSLHPTLPTVGIILTDLTEKKEHEKILQQTNRELLNANEELSRNNKELQSFAYISSHDLQEPLRKIQTFATRIIEKERDNLSENGKDNFRRMQEAARRMQTLINDLLSYSRTSTGERKFETVDLKTIIDEVKDDLKEELKEKHATIETVGACEVYIIPFQFRQLMLNLIGNSLKFSNPQTPPIIKIKSRIEEGVKLNNQNLSPQKRYCHICVTDNGIGFEQEYSEKIFEVFQRLHGKSEYDGTGIGLSIVKKIIENHNGIITATSELNKGASFDIYLPTNRS